MLKIRSFTKNRSKNSENNYLSIGIPRSNYLFPNISEEEFWLELVDNTDPHILFVYDNLDSPPAHIRRYFIVDLDAGTVFWRHRSRRPMVEVLNKCGGLRDFDAAFPGVEPRHLRVIEAVKLALSKL